MAPPANDNFANAQTLSTTLPASLTGLTTFDATEEASEPNVFNFGGTMIEQAVWFKFTPTVTGTYRFLIPLSSMTYHGTTTAADGEINICVFNSSCTSLATATSGNIIDIISAYTDPGWYFPDRHNAALNISMVSGTTYYIKIGSAFGTSANRSTVDFDFQWELLAAAGNDNFASRTTISGSSGSQAYNVEAATAEASEPDPFYQYEDSPIGSVWFEWTAPSSGWFDLEAQYTDWNRDSPTLAVYTGSSLAGLTPIVKNSGGAPTTSANPNGGGTHVKFNATSGTVYKIQIAGSDFYTARYGGAGTLTWATGSAPTGDTAATALTSGGRVNNYGNSDDDAPPNGITRLDAHGGVWYDTTGMGRSKWFKIPITVNTTIEIKGHMYDSGDYGYSEVGLLAYKGANYAGLSAATTTLSEDAVLWGGGGSTKELRTNLNHDSMLISCTAGEILWICMVSTFDRDYDNDSVFIGQENAPQTSLDLPIGVPPPANDTWAAVWADTTYLYKLNRDLYDDGTPYGPEAGKRDGTTISATADVGEASRAGFAATRSVWYYWYPPDLIHTYRFWVESSQDCVLGIYDVAGPGSALGSLLLQDDDSGTGNWPQIDVDVAALWNGGAVGRAWTGNAFAIVVDSKAEGTFTLKYQRVYTGTPPANDDFASATVIGSIPYSGSGTTVNARAEVDEHSARELGTGPKDTVWYKYVATFNGRLKIKAKCTSNNDDAEVYVDCWRGTTLDTLVRSPEPPPTTAGGVTRGFFNFFYTPAENEARALNLDLVNGQTYYIRVQTQSGGSETFDIQAEVDATYLDIQPSGSDEMHGTLLDAVTVPLRFTVTAVEHFSTTTDAATVPLDLVASGVDIKAFVYADAATAYVDMIAITEHECIFHLEPSWHADGIRKWSTNGSSRRWALVDTSRKWTWIEGEGQPQVC